MKARDLIEILQENPDLEVMSSKGNYSAEVIVAEERKMCKIQGPLEDPAHRGYWRKCGVKTCGAESVQAFFLT
jgi:hypothetical protein